jgi:hypothetical protein
MRSYVSAGPTGDSAMTLLAAGATAEAAVLRFGTSLETGVLGTGAAVRVLGIGNLSNVRLKLTFDRRPGQGTDGKRQNPRPDEDEPPVAKRAQSRLPKQKERRMMTLAYAAHWRNPPC